MARLNRGIRAVLIEMSGDATAQEWASILGCRSIDIYRFCQKAGLPLQFNPRRNDHRARVLLDAIADAYADTAG